MKYSLFFPGWGLKSPYLLEDIFGNCVQNTGNSSYFGWIFVSSETLCNNQLKKNRREQRKGDSFAIFEHHPPLLCRNMIPEGKGLSSRLDFSPRPEGRQWAPGVRGATPQPEQRRDRPGAGVAPCSDRPVTRAPAFLRISVTRVTSPHIAPNGDTKSLNNKQREEQV